jgi:hypothetical protein
MHFERLEHLSKLSGPSILRVMSRVRGGEMFAWHHLSVEPYISGKYPAQRACYWS